MNRPLNTRHLSLLNRLADMQMSPYYAPARETLAEAERVINLLEAEIGVLAAREGGVPEPTPAPPSPGGLSRCPHCGILTDAPCITNRGALDCHDGPDGVAPSPADQENNNAR